MAKAVKKITLPDEIIVNKIYYIRKQKIMLDRDFPPWSVSHRPLQVLQVFRTHPYNE